MARNHINYIKSTDTVAKADAGVDAKAQEEAVASVTPKSANEHLKRNTTGYVDGDGSGAKGTVDDPAQQALLEVGDTQADPKAQAETQKSADEGKGVDEPQSAPDQVKAIGEAQQRAVEEQEKRAKEAEKQLEQQKKDEAKQTEDKSKVQVDEFVHPASSQAQGGKEVSTKRVSVKEDKDSDKK